MCGGTTHTQTKS